MKKIIFLLFAVAGMAAQAQFTLGFNSGFSHLNHNGEKRNEYLYTLSPGLMLGYRVADHLTVGITGNISYMCNGDRYEVPENPPAQPGEYPNYYDTKYSCDEVLLWNAGVYAHYDIPLTSHLSLFAHLTAGYGNTYSRHVVEKLIYNPSTQSYDSRTTKRNGDNIIASMHADLTPGVSYHFNSHLSADLYLNVLSLSYCHYTIHPRKGGSSKVSYNTTSFGTQNYLMWVFLMDSYQLMTSPGQLSSFNIGINYTF